MKITFITTTSYIDTTLPLVSELLKKHSVHLIINYSENIRVASFIKIKEYFNANTIKECKISMFGELSKIISTPTNLKISIVYWVSWKNFNLNNFLFIPSILKLIYKGSIVHIQQPSLFYLIALKLRRNKFIIDYHDPFEHTGSKEKYGLKILKYLYNALSKKIILHNFQNSEKFFREHKLKRSKIAIIPFGTIPLNKIVNFETTLKEEEKTVLFFGRVTQYKGIEYLIEATKLLSREIPQIRTIIAGEGEFYFDITGILNDQNFEIHNYYINNQRLAEFISRCTVVVCPYTDATQSGVVMTAYAFNKPVIATDVGSFREYIINGETGIIVPPRNAEALAEAIKTLIGNRTLVDNMKENISRLKENEFSWEVAANNLINVYREID